MLLDPLERRDRGIHWLQTQRWERSLITSRRDSLDINKVWPTRTLMYWHRPTTRYFQASVLGRNLGVFFAFHWLFRDLVMKFLFRGKIKWWLLLWPFMIIWRKVSVKNSDLVNYTSSWLTDWLWGCEGVIVIIIILFSRIISGREVPASRSSGE